MNFRKILLAGMLVFTLFSLTSCKENRVDLVRNSIFFIYGDTEPFGQAIDNFNGCKPKTQKWTSFETGNGMEVVTFECVAKNLLTLFEQTEKYDTKVILKKEDKDAVFALANAQYRIQFGIIKNIKNEDAPYVQRTDVILTWKDGKKATFPVNPKPEKDFIFMQNIYKNNDAYGDLLEKLEKIKKSRDMSFIMHLTLTKALAESYYTRK